MPKCLFWRHALTPLAGLYSELGTVSIGIAHVRRLFGAFEPKRYLPLSKIADGVRGAEVSEIVDAREKTVKTRMFCARKRLSELLASKNIYTACSWDACRSLDWKLIWTLNKGDDYAFVCTRCYRRHHIRGDYDFRDFLRKGCCLLRRGHVPGRQLRPD